jgi:hypothetical protein
MDRLYDWRQRQQFLCQSERGATPVSGLAIPTNPGGGSYIALSDQVGPGGEEIVQNFTVAPNMIRRTDHARGRSARGGPLLFDVLVYDSHNFA